MTYRETNPVDDSFVDKFAKDHPKLAKFFGKESKNVAKKKERKESNGTGN